MRCSAEGCTFESDDIVTDVGAAGLRPYCGYHATGRDLADRSFVLRPSCACGKAAAGFESLVGGYSARHTERSCFERTIASSPEDVTAPEGRPGTGPLPQKQIVPAQKCACGKGMDGAMSAYPGFTESHSVRECIEQTTKGGGG